MKQSLLKEIPLIAFGIVWVCFIFLDYWNKHPFYSISFEHFRHINYSVFLILGMTVVGALYHFKKTKRMDFLFSGISLFVLALIFSTLICINFIQYAEGSTGVLHALTYVGNALINFLELVLIFFSVFSIGYLLLKLVDFDIRESSRTIYSTVIGIMAITFILFLIAIIGLLHNFVIIPLLVIPIILNWRKNLQLIKELTIQNVFDKDSKVNFLTGVLIVLIISLITINFLSCMGPFPSGFDSRNYYVNISKLLGDYNGLVKGFQPYSWSLFMSIGNIAFKNISLTLLISFSGLLLTLWALWELCRSYFRLTINHSLFVMLMILTIPAIFNQLYIEQKIDFGLLFVQVCSILLLTDIVDKIKSNLNFRIDKDLVKLFILLGVFSGFALGIKATHLYMLFSIVILLWTLYCGYFGFLAAFFFTLFVIFVGKLDDVSGLRDYHLGIGYLKYLMLIMSGVFFSISAIKNRKAFIASTKISSILGIVSLLVLLPWMIKNYSDSPGSINPSKLIMGDNPGPKIGLEKMVRNYESKKKEQ